jgi:hypothetical protein
MNRSISTSVEYNNFIFRILAAFAAALFLVKYGERISIFKALLLPSFYMAMIGSFIIAFFLIYIVHYVTVGLDKRTGWQDNPLKRALFQFIFAFMLPVILAYLLAAIYFMFYDINILNTDYDILDFPVTIIMIFGLNVYYYFYAYIYRLKTAKSQNVEPELSTAAIRELIPHQKEYVLVHVNNEELYLHAVEEVCYFYCLNNSYLVKTFDNKTYGIDKTLKELEDIYAGQHFFRLNRNTILNFNAIHSLTQEKKDRGILVHLKPGLFTGKPDEEIRRFSIPKEKVIAFKRWIDR